MFKLGTDEDFFKFIIWRFFFKKKGENPAYPNLFISLFWGRLLFLKRLDNVRQRYSDDDIVIGPLLFCKTDWKSIALIFQSKNPDEESDKCVLTLRIKGYVLRISLPDIIKPYVTKQTAGNWDKATIERLGRDWYPVYHTRTYGFCLDGNFFQLFYGIQYADLYKSKKLKPKSWSCHLPWTQWRFYKFSTFDAEGKVFLECFHKPKQFDDITEVRNKTPSIKFLVEDYDGTSVIASTILDERMWLKGEGKFKWLSYFYKPKVIRNLDIRFNKEIGKDKGTWKGGLIGHSLEVIPGELHEQVFRRYCEQKVRSRNGKSKIKFIRKLENDEVPEKAPDQVILP